MEIPVFNANSVDLDQTPCSAASDLGLHCLPIPFYRTQGISGFNMRCFPCFHEFYRPLRHTWNTDILILNIGLPY